MQMKKLSVNLSNKSLKTVPRSILDNPNLKALYLNDNQLTQLPDFIMSLKSLEVLTLRNNSFKIVPEQIFTLNNLKTLILSENQITQIPKEIMGLSKLENFDFGSNPILKFPDWLHRLNSLKDLGIYDLKLKTLPEVVCQIKKLEILSLDGNDLITLPKSIGNLQSLKELWTESNYYTFLPETFGNLIHLERVNLRDNKLEYLPESIVNLQRLEQLHVDENLLKSIPEGIFNLSNLSNLDLSNNQIVNVPISLLNVKDLDVFVWFEGNPLSKSAVKLIKKVYPDMDKSSIGISVEGEKNTTTEIIEQVIGSYHKNEDGGITKNTVGLMVIFSVLFPMILFLFFSKKSNPIQDINKNSIAEYRKIRDLYEQKFAKILSQNKSIVVYTNDTSDLEVILKPNIDSFYNFYDPDYTNREDKISVLNKFLNDSRVGFQTILNNNRVSLKLGSIFDSVYSKSTVKKYSLIVDYKMTEKEIAIEKKRMSKYGVRKSKDSVYNTEKVTLTSIELNNGKMSSNLKQIILPIINLKDKEYHFYFTPYDNNYTNLEFKEAIEDFKRMFIKGDSLINTGEIRSLKLQK